MQPYFFPYLGYFQLIKSVDAFVVFDDVNYIKGGWINRNYILFRDAKQLLTLSLQGASSNKLINHISIGNDRSKLLKSVEQCYSKAPMFSEAFPLIENILRQDEHNLARFLDQQLREICSYLGIAPKWFVSSHITQNASLKGQDRVIEICERLGADHYVNAPGGRSLYDREAFVRRGMQLSFIEPQLAPYRQFKDGFVSNLSIIDVIMFNDNIQCANLLQRYDVV